MEKRHVLVVEDDYEAQQFIREILLTDGYEVWTASGAKGALRLINEQPYDLLITDLNLGGVLSGWGLIDQLRPSHPNLPVIVVSGVVSGLSTEERKKLVEKYNVAWVFSKPLNLPAFREAVGSILLRQ